MGKVSDASRYGQDLMGRFVTNAAQYNRAVALIRTPQGGVTGTIRANVAMVAHCSMHHRFRCCTLLQSRGSQLQAHVNDYMAKMLLITPARFP